jgi:hypothetical protein
MEALSTSMNNIALDEATRASLLKKNLDDFLSKSHRKSQNLLQNRNFFLKNRKNLRKIGQHNMPDYKPPTPTSLAF